MKTYTLEAVENLIQKYYEKDPDMEMVEIEQGVLGYGTTVLRAEKLKTAIIQERYEGPWSSSHTIRLYNKTPKKYEDLIEKFFAREDEEV